MLEYQTIASKSNSLRVPFFWRCAKRSYLILEGPCSITVIVVGNGHDNQSSCPELWYWCFILAGDLEKGKNPIPLTIGKQKGRQRSLTFEWKEVLEKEISVFELAIYCGKFKPFVEYCVWQGEVKYVLDVSKLCQNTGIYSVDKRCIM